MKDLIIIGGGPGGYVAAIRARQLGMRVTLIEKDALGGTCLNRGCIPTKAYYRNAQAMQDIRSSGALNIQVEGVTFDMAGARQRKNAIVQELTAGVEKLFVANGVEQIKGTAQLLDKNTVGVKGQEFRAHKILLASGSVPATLPIPGADLPGVINSDQALELEKVPARFAIVGGGVIGLEFATIFSALGSEVTVYEYLPDLLNGFDRELGKRLRVFLRRQRIDVHTCTRVDQIEPGPGPEGGLLLKAIGKSGQLEKPADLVLVAIGRKPCTDGLNLAGIGIQTDKAGFIQVDRRDFSTNVKNIFAIGDVIGDPMLAHVASEEGVVAVENMAGHATKIDYQVVPACVFTRPEIASVGLSEEAAKAQGLTYHIGKFQFGANGKALAMGQGEGMVKVLVDTEQVIIGVHIIGPQASNLSMEGVMMVKNRLCVPAVAGTIHPHPTLSEALKEAVLATQGRAVHAFSHQR